MKESFWRKQLLSVWEVWERFFGELHHIQKIRPDGLFRLNSYPYHGPAVELDDGTVVKPGDLVGELHLSSLDAMNLNMGFNSRVKSAITTRRELTRDLICLAKRTATEQSLSEVRAFYAITMLYHGARVLGFEDRELESRVQRWLYTMGEGFLLAIYHPAGIFRFWQGRQELSAKYIWMSRQKLLGNFLTRRPHQSKDAEFNSQNSK
jgi:hypothetical protein